MDSYRNIFDWLSKKVCRALRLRGGMVCWKSGTNHGELVVYEGVEDPGTVLPSGSGGVLIGRGIDMARHLASSLEKHACPPEIVCLVAPHAGRRGANAIASLHEHPLVLTSDQAESLTWAAWENLLEGEFIPGWNSRMPAARDWRVMTWEMQAAVFAIFVVFGWAPFDKLLDLRKALQMGRWSRAGAIMKAGQGRWDEDWMKAYEIGHMLEQAGR